MQDTITDLEYELRKLKSNREELLSRNSNLYDKLKEVERRQEGINNLHQEDVHIYKEAVDSKNKEIERWKEEANDCKENYIKIQAECSKL